MDNLPELRLFTTAVKDVDWFGWGDVVYVSLSLFLFVTVFMDAGVTLTNIFYVIGE